LKRASPKTIRLFSENSSGRFQMQVGETYLLFAYDALGRTAIDNCGNSGLVHDRAYELGAVRSMNSKHGA
jgi:hypothetical protein